MTISKREGIEENCYVLYAQVNLTEKEFHARKNSGTEWFTFKQTTKLSFSDQIKRDIVVAERVINAKARNDAETFSPVGLQ